MSRFPYAALRVAVLSCADLPVWFPFISFSAVVSEPCKVQRPLFPLYFTSFSPFFAKFSVLCMKLLDFSEIHLVYMDLVFHFEVIEIGFEFILCGKASIIKVPVLIIPLF